MKMTAARTNARTWRLGATLLCAALIATACGSEGEDSSSPADETQAPEADAEAPDADGVIRMAAAPDPVWDWLNDQGIRQEMEEEAGITIIESVTWDDFGVYAGGHVDVVSAAAYEVPLLEEETGVPTTVFGKYNADRSLILTRAGTEYETICDLEGETIATHSSVAITIIWAVYAQELCGLDLSPESDDYDLVVTDIQNTAPLVTSGDAAACICVPDFALRQLAAGDLQPIHDGLSAAEIFAEGFGDGHLGPQTNVFLAPTAWLNANQEEAAFLLAVWERGLQEWDEHKNEMIEAYPQHFAADGEEDIEFIKDYINNEFDWFEDTVAIDQEWIEGESQLFELMVDTGMLGADVDLPTFTPIEPAA